MAVKELQEMDDIDRAVNMETGPLGVILEPMYVLPKQTYPFFTQKE